MSASTAADPCDAFFESFRTADTDGSLRRAEEGARQRVQAFLAAQHRHAEQRRIALVTSGGTTVPLERNTVRFLDNFSGGRRGSASAENFIRKGYSVVFLHRKNSLLPYHRHFMVGRPFLSYLELTADGDVHGHRDDKAKLADVLREHDEAVEQDRLLLLDFTSVHEYLFLLRAVCEELQSVNERALIYSAAAVADFFLPPEDVATHKIQSRNGGAGLQLNFSNTPKMLRPLVKLWCPMAFIVSFKLETDEDILEDKVNSSIEQYGQHCVVANLLHSHQNHVWIYSNTTRVPGDVERVRHFERTAAEQDAQVDIEGAFVPAIVDLHDQCVPKNA